MTSALVLLTKNEIAGSKALFDKIPFHSFDEAFVVDYRSSDGTVEFFESKGVRVVKQEIPGRGEVFRMASEIARSDILVFFSPDGNEDPADTVKLRDLVAGGCDLAVASRFMQESRNDEAEKLLPLRAWANQAFTVAANIFFGGHMTDTINGFRAVRKDKFKLLKPDAQGFAIEYQISIRAMKLGFTIKEIPSIEGDRIGGMSTAYSIPTGLKILKILLREIWLGKRF